MFLKHLHEGGRPCSACPAGYPPFCRALVDPKGEHSGPPRPVVAQDFEVVEPHRNIYLRNAKTEDIYVLCDGWAFTFLQTADGRRQIVSFLVAGDFFSCDLLIEESSGLSLRTLTKSLFCRMRRAEVRHLVLKSDETLNIVGHACIAMERAKNDLLLDLGRRNADERIAHLILTLTERLDRLGTPHDGNYPFPLRQQDIAAATGLTPVHVGRMISKFREFGFIELSAGHLRVLNRAELVHLGRID
ncbi:MAG: Crp/Fnr family transcriptional regulator [Methylovirgula sp.]